MSHTLHQIITYARWTSDEARQVLDALEASGLTVSEFAIRHGVQVQRLYAWRRKLSEDRAPPAMASFIEVAAGDGLVHRGRRRRWPRSSRSPP